MAKTTWKTLLKRLERLYEFGKPLIDVDGKAIRGDFAAPPEGNVKQFKFPDALDELIECLVAIDEKLHVDRWPGVRCRIDRQLDYFTRKPLLAVQDLELSDFGNVLEGDILSNDDPDNFDPIVARDGFATFVRLLTAEVRPLTARRQPEPLSPEAAREVGNYWTREQFADFLEYEDPTSVTKDISEYRKKNEGEEPPWIVYLAPYKKKYKVKWKVYLQEMNSGRAKKPRSWRY